VCTPETILAEGSHVIKNNIFYPQAPPLDPPLRSVNVSLKFAVYLKENLKNLAWLFLESEFGDANKRVLYASLGHKCGGAFCLLIQEDSTRDIASTMGNQLI